MTSSVDTNEAEVVNRLELTHFGSVYCVRLKRLGLELGRARVGEGIRNVEVAKPVANEVGITSPSQNADTRLDNG